jgi:hypothetical protein
MATIWRSLFAVNVLPVVTAGGVPCLADMCCVVLEQATLDVGVNDPSQPLGAGTATLG